MAKGMDTDADIIKMKKELNIELACEQVFIPSAPPMYPTLHIYDTVSSEPVKIAPQSNNYNTRTSLFLAIFVIWLLLGLFAFLQKMFDAVSLEKFDDISYWLTIPLDFRSISFLVSTSFGTFVTSAIFLTVLKNWSKGCLYFFLAVVCIATIALMLLTFHLFNIFISEEKIEMGAAALMCLLGTLSLGIIPHLIGKKEVDEISIFLKDSSKAVIFFPHSVLIMVFVLILLVSEFLSFKMIFSVGSNLIVLSFLIQAINIITFLWTIFMTLDLGYLAMTSTFILSKTAEDINFLTRPVIFSKILIIIKHSLDDVVCGSSFESILKHAIIIWNLPFKLSNYTYGIFFMINKLFNNGTYTIHIMKKKNFSTSTKLMAETLFKNPLKYFIYVLVSLFFTTVMLALSFLVTCILYAILLEESIRRGRGSYMEYDKNHLMVVSLLYANLPSIAVGGSLMSAFYTMMVYHLSTTTDIELINIGVGK